MPTNDFIDKKVNYNLSNDAHSYIYSFILFNFSNPLYSSIPTYLHSYSHYFSNRAIPLFSISLHDRIYSTAAALRRLDLLRRAPIEMKVETLRSHPLRTSRSELRSRWISVAFESSIRKSEKVLEVKRLLVNIHQF